MEVVRLFEEEGWSQLRIAKRFRIHVNTVGNIVRRHRQAEQEASE